MNYQKDNFRNFLQEGNFDLEVTQETCIRAMSKRDDDPRCKSQLEYIVVGSNCYWGDVKILEDCFQERIVDNGMVVTKELSSSRTQQDDDDDKLKFWYWVAYFGGNPTGYLLRRQGEGEDGWTIVIENCDGDFIWRDEEPENREFLKSVKKAVLGDYYYEEEDE